MRKWIAATVGLLLCCVLLPAQASPRFDPASVIAAPSGWTHETLNGSRSAALGVVLAQWFTEDRGREEFIEIGSHRNFGFTDESFGAFYQTYLQRDGQNISVYRQQTLCRGERGWYVRHRESDRYGGGNIEDVYVLDGSKVYFASYHYPRNFSAAATARRAILSLCIPQPVAARPVIFPFKFVAPRDWLLSDPRRAGVPVWHGIIGGYVDPHNFNQAIDLSQMRVNGADASSGSAAAAKVLAKERKDVTNVSGPVIQLQPLCDGHVGWLATYNETYRGEKLIVEEMMLPGLVTYSAAYVRPASVRESPQARAALTTLCPLSSENSA